MRNSALNPVVACARAGLAALFASPCLSAGEFCAYLRLMGSISTVLTNGTARAIYSSSGERLKVTECDISLSEHSCMTCRCTHSQVLQYAMRHNIVYPHQNR